MLILVFMIQALLKCIASDSYADGSIYDLGTVLIVRFDCFMLACITLRDHCAGSREAMALAVLRPWRS